MDKKFTFARDKKQLLRIKMSGDCPHPTLRNGVILTNPNATYPSGYTLDFECKDKYKLKTGDLSQICLESGEWEGTAPACERKKDNDNDDVAVTFVAIGITLGTIVVLFILFIDFYMHVRRRLRSKRYQKRRQVLELGGSTSHKRPVPFFVTATLPPPGVGEGGGLGAGGYTNRGFSGGGLETGIYPTDEELQNGAALIGRLPPIDLNKTGPSPSTKRKKKKKKQIAPTDSEYGTSSSFVSEHAILQQAMSSTKGSKNKAKRKQTIIKMGKSKTTSFDNNTYSQSDLNHTYGSERNNNDSRFVHPNNQHRQPILCRPEDLYSTYQHSPYNGTAPPTSLTPPVAPPTNQAKPHTGPIPGQNVIQSRGSLLNDIIQIRKASHGYPKVLEKLDMYEHDPNIQPLKPDHRVVLGEYNNAFPQFEPQTRQIEKTRLKMMNANATGSDVESRHVVGVESRPLPPRPLILRQSPHQQSVPAVVEAQNGSGIPV